MDNRTSESRRDLRFPPDGWSIILTMKDALTVTALQQCAADFAVIESAHGDTLLFGVTDGKAIGTYLEQKFRAYVLERYHFDEGNSARGIDFPSLDVDVKTTSVR